MSLYVKICEDWIANSWEINFHRLVAEAMWYWLQRLCGAGCGGYVGWLQRLCGMVAEAMWCSLRRLCVGLTDNKANSACKLCFILCWGWAWQKCLKCLIFLIFLICLKYLICLIPVGIWLTAKNATTCSKEDKTQDHLYYHLSGELGYVWF